MPEKAGKVLLIDDDELFAECIRNALESREYEVLVASDGSAGVETARREQPDVIIVDLLMGPPDGFAITDTLRSDPRTRRSAILVVSAIGRKLHKHVESIEVGARLDTDGYLDKPVDLDVLVERVEDMVRLARSRVSGQEDGEASGASAPEEGE